MTSIVLHSQSSTHVMDWIADGLADVGFAAILAPRSGVHVERLGSLRFVCAMPKDHRLPDDVGKMIVVDGVFSMEGDVCKLPDLVRLKRQYGARLMVDDAHGLGVLGEHGRGTAEHFGLDADDDLVMGTFSKSLAAAGGFIAGDRYIVDYIRHHARAQIFSAAPPPALAAAVLAALDIVIREPERRAQLWENRRYMQHELESLGSDTAGSETPVIPMVVGDDRTVFSMVSRLHEDGVFVNPVITPAVPPGQP